MPLKVVSFATYLTRNDAPWRDDDFNAMKFVKALKGETINKYAWVPVGDVRRYLNQENADETIEWFGDWTASYLKSKRLPRPLALVPIPGSSCAVTNKKVPRTVRLAEAVATRLQRVDVCDALRWKKPMTPSSKGGTRNPQEIYDNMVVTRKLPDARLVLIDDVRTTGGHLRAATVRLIEKGGHCSLAVCAARTVLAQEDEPFMILEEELDDFVPAK